MTRQRERLLTRHEEPRRSRASAALTFAAAGLLFTAAAVAGTLAFALYQAGTLSTLSLATLFPAAGRAAGELGPGLLFPAAVALLLLAVLAGALYVRLRPRNYVEVDPSSGTATFVRDGSVARRVPVAEVGPLEQAQEVRRVPSGKSYRTATFHIARSRPFPELVLHESESELAARRALEAHAKRWELPCVGLSGVPRSPAELDVPLCERLLEDESAMATWPQRPGSHLAVDWTGDGYEITTRYRPPLDKAKVAATFLVPPFVVFWVLGDLVRAGLGDSLSTPFPWLAGAVVVGAFVPGVVILVRHWLRSRFPPSIRVTATEVTVGRRSLPLRSIEEIDRVKGSAPRLVSDERILAVRADFCQEAEYDWLEHELERLLLGMGLGRPPGAQRP